MKRLIFALALLLMVLPYSLAQNSDEPQKAIVSVYVLNLGKFDVSTGSFTIDFYLDILCSLNCEDVKFEFMNGRATSTELIIDEKNERFYRIQANLNSPVNLKSFPFDSQTMQIIIEDKESTIEDLIFIPDDMSSGIDESIAFTGWQITDWESRIEEHYYKPYDETYSQYIFEIDISRIKFNSFLKTFLPVFFIITVTIFSFLIDPDKITNRLGVAGSSLVASVMFHVAITNQIPPVGYMTFADKFMILTYFILLGSFILNIMLLQFQEMKKEALVMKIHKATEYSVLFIVPILYLILFIFFI